MNQSGPPTAGRPTSGRSRIRCPFQRVQAALARDAQLIDPANRPHALRSEHVPGSVSIPAGSSFGTWLGWVVEPDRPLVLLLDDPGDWDGAIRQALRIG